MLTIIPAPGQGQCKHYPWTNIPSVVLQTCLMALLLLASDTEVWPAKRAIAYSPQWALASDDPNPSDAIETDSCQCPLWIRKKRPIISRKVWSLERKIQWRGRYKRALEMRSPPLVSAHLPFLHLKKNSRIFFTENIRAIMRSTVA